MVGECKLRNSHITELGCGTCDISGSFSFRNDVYAYDCNPEALEIALDRFPLLKATGPIPEAEPCDILILCEFLEHIPDPLTLIKAWLPLAGEVVISHPLNGDLVRDLSGGEHQWSYNEEDFKRWFAIGGHEVIHQEIFQMGGYEIIIGRGKRTV